MLPGSTNPPFQEHSTWSELSGALGDTQGTPQATSCRSSFDDSYLSYSLSLPPPLERLMTTHHHSGSTVFGREARGYGTLGQEKVLSSSRSTQDHGGSTYQYFPESLPRPEIIHSAEYYPSSVEISSLSRQSFHHNPSVERHSRTTGRGFVNPYPLPAAAVVLASSRFPYPSILFRISHPTLGDLYWDKGVSLAAILDGNYGKVEGGNEQTLRGYGVPDRKLHITIECERFSYRPTRPRKVLVTEGGMITKSRILRALVDIVSEAFMQKFVGRDGSFKGLAAYVCKENIQLEEIRILSLQHRKGSDWSVMIEVAV